MPSAPSLQGQNMLQLRPAHGQAEQEHKLFVGMMPRSITEEEVRAVFELFGKVREVHLMRNQDPAVMDCAFVKYVDHDSALTAIGTLNEHYMMCGGSRPLVVKFAANKRKPRVPPAQWACTSPDTLNSRPSHANGGQRRYFAAAQTDGCAHPVQATVPHTISQQSSANTLVARIPSLGYGNYFPSSPAGFRSTTLEPDGCYPGSPSPAAGEVDYGANGSMSHSQELKQDNWSYSAVAASKTKEGLPGANLFVHRLPQYLSDFRFSNSFCILWTLLELYGVH